MRALILFLASTLATAAGAQSVPPAAHPPTPSEAASGKIQLGLEGRGNYRKPKEKVAPDAKPTLFSNQSLPAQHHPEDETEDSASHDPEENPETDPAPTKTQPPAVTATAPTPPPTATSATQPAPVATPVAAPLPQAQRSDSSLRSDKPKPTTTPLLAPLPQSTPEVEKPKTNATASPTFVNGKLVQP